MKIGNTIIGLIIIALFTFFMFYMIKGFWSFATFFAWFFIAIAAIVNYRVIIDYVKRLVDLLKRNPLFGIGGILFTVLLYPLVFLVLMFRALGSRALSNVKSERDTERFSEYEVLEEETFDLDKLKIKDKSYR